MCYVSFGHWFCLKPYFLHLPLFRLKVLRIFQTLFDGSVSLIGKVEDLETVKILHITEESQSFVLTDYSTETCTIVQGIETGFVFSVPFHQVLYRLPLIKCQGALAWQFVFHFL